MLFARDCHQSPDLKRPWFLPQWWCLPKSGHQAETGSIPWVQARGLLQDLHSGYSRWGFYWPSCRRWRCASTGYFRLFHVPTCPTTLETASSVILVASGCGHEDSVWKHMRRWCRGGCARDKSFFQPWTESNRGSQVDSWSSSSRHASHHWRGLIQLVLSLHRRTCYQ